MEAAFARNAYVCETCGHRTVTVNACEGVTPYLIRCRFNCCGGTAKSQLYRISQHERPTFEWYSPEAEERQKLDRHTLQHVEHGGLLLRRLEILRAEQVYGIRLRQG